MSSSPFVSGQGFIGGKSYQIKLKKEEKHLLPPPYQTNCTDYTKDWLLRGGVAPLNQLMVIEECRLNASIRELGCVPYSVDYPHNETICKWCEENCTSIRKVGEDCANLLAKYNQPCDSSFYHMSVEDKLVYIITEFHSSFASRPESFVVKAKSYNCSFDKIFTRVCQTTNIEIDFNEYEVTNITYNPKFENLELLSIVGSYMGMYLGISMLTVYNFIELTLVAIYGSVKKKMKHSKVKRTQKNWGKTQDGYYYNEPGFRRRHVPPPSVKLY